MTRPQRLIWVVNHRTLLPAEIPIFRDLGYEVLIPKSVPEREYRSGVVTYDLDASLTVPASALRVLNSHDFYRRAWGPTVSEVVNDLFDAVVTSVSTYLTPLAEAARVFEGTLVARVFGLEQPRRYADYFLDPRWAPILPALEAMGERFVFGQGFANLADVEEGVLQERSHTITVPLPPTAYAAAGTWRGDGGRALFLCPAIEPVGYYRDVYDGLKADFGDLPHEIFGRQLHVIDDMTVLPELSDADLIDRYAAAAVFVYPSTEPRHVHYSPIEAMIVGAPVLYRAGSLLDILAGTPLPGSCRDTEEMHAKASALITGDRALAEQILAAQPRLVKAFSTETATRQWASVLRPERMLDR